MIIRSLALAVALLLFAASIANAGPPAKWHDRFSPYRIHLTLEHPVTGAVSLDIEPQTLIDELSRASVDVTDIDTFAFEKAQLIDPQTGAAVGRFKLLPVGNESPIDGVETLGLAISKWQSYGTPAPMERTKFDASEAEALWLFPTTFGNCGFSQPVSFEAGALYLLRYQLNCDPIDGNLYATIVNPARKYFRDVHHSYYSRLPPRAEWTQRNVLYRPDITEAKLSLTTAFTGRCGIADLHLQKVALRLVADLAEPTDEIDLYVVLRAGHHLPVPDSMLHAGPLPPQQVAIKTIVAEAANLNPDAVRIESEGVSAWTISPDLPLKTSLLKSVAPAAVTGDNPIQVQLVRGASQTVLIAIDTGSPQASFDGVTTDLALKPTVERLGEIPVYDRSYPRGELIETRLDALTPLDFNLMPDTKTGIHVVALTFHADESATAGDSAGTITIRVKTPTSTSLRIPIQLSVASLTVRPMDHFGSLFGGQHLSVKYSGGTYTETGTSVIEFHGFTKANPTVNPPGKTDGPTSVRELMWKYNHRLLDFDLIPTSLGGHSAYTYRVVESEDKDDPVPELTDWDFARYDEAIDEFLLGRGASQWQIAHTNGELMDHLRLANGKTYTFKPTEDRAGWVQLSEADYYRLIGDFFEPIAAHLEAKGVLDRAVLLIDESDPSTYPVIRDYVVRGLRTRPHAKRIRTGHTAYKTAYWTRRDENGKLMLDGIIDVPMPDNDELINCFEPEWNSRMKEEQEQWVYYVETDHLNLLNAGLSTAAMPLKLEHFGAKGWYCWASFIWSMPFPHTEQLYAKFFGGPVVNPWINPQYHHGPGVLSFFYPPDPRGPAAQPTDLVIPSYRLSLMRDGIQLRSLLEVLEAGRDDLGQPIEVDAQKLALARQKLSELWPENPVQWYLSYSNFREARHLLFEAIQ